jgi:hypothetical protein
MSCILPLFTILAQLDLDKRVSQKLTYGDLWVLNFIVNFSDFSNFILIFDFFSRVIICLKAEKIGIKKSFYLNPYFMSENYENKILLVKKQAALLQKRANLIGKFFASIPKC